MHPLPGRLLAALSALSRLPPKPGGGAARAYPATVPFDASSESYESSSSEWETVIGSFGRVLPHPLRGRSIVAYPDPYPPIVEPYPPPPPLDPLDPTPAARSAYPPTPPTPLTDAAPIRAFLSVSPALYSLFFCARFSASIHARRSSPSRFNALSTSPIAPHFTLASSGLSMLNDGEWFTSMSHGRSFSSMMISKPRSSKHRLGLGSSSFNAADGLDLPDSSPGLASSA
mmetsp:Transcript_8413/g.38165  ORF Transcript_8413/g.38165 Transcript_8413/m.38165 type:complete len:229 (-) Transcript_8413:1118-1804(-)